MHSSLSLHCLSGEKVNRRMKDLPSLPTSPISSYSSYIALSLLGFVACGALWLTHPSSPQVEWVQAFLLGYGVAWSCFLAAALIVTRLRIFPCWLLALIILIAIVLRLIAVIRTPELSVDAHRYLWDGRIFNAEINPFRYAPADPELRYLRDENWHLTGFHSVRTVYPPVAQFLFAAVARTQPQDTIPFRWLFAVFDIAGILVLISLLKQTNRPREHVIWYAWCPLAITEFAGGAHVDAVGIFLFLLALRVWMGTRYWHSPASAVILAAAVMTKGFAVLALPFLIRYRGWRYAAWFGIACLVLLAPFLDAGRYLFDGLGQFLGGWQANASLFHLGDYLLADVTPDHYMIIRTISTLLILCILALLVKKQQPGSMWMIGTSFAALSANLILGAPTCPWYVVWILPALCWWRIPALILLSLTISIQYYAYRIDPIHVNVFLWIGYTPVYSLLLWQGLKMWRMRRSAVEKTNAT